MNALKTAAHERRQAQVPLRPTLTIPQGGQRQNEPPNLGADLADDAALGHPDAVEVHGARARGLEAHLLLLFPHAQPRLRALHQEARDPCAAARIRQRVLSRKK